MTEAATAWPGQEVVAPPQWPGQEVMTAQQGEHGYAPAPPKPEPAESGRWAAPVGGEFGDLAAQPWAQPGPPPSPATPVDPSAPPPGDTQLTTAQYGQEKALDETANKSGYFALEPSEPGFAHLVWSLGAPFAKIGQIATGDRPMPTGVGALETAAPLAGMSDLRFTARPHPMMQAYEAQTAALREAREAAQRYGPPEAPPERFGPPGPPDPAVESGTARVRGQYSMGQEPLHHLRCAEAVPPGVPPGTTVPMSLRAGAAINAEAASRPGFVPNTNVDPLTGQATPVRVPPGAAGPETVPYAPPTPEAAPVVAPAEAPGTQSVGAAASREGTPAADIGLTPEQADAAGSTADKQWLYQTAVPGEADNTVYLKGINPTMAQREQTVNAARDSKLLRRISPEAEQNERALLAEHTNIRKGEFQDIAGSDVTHEAEMEAANNQIDKQLKAAYANGGKVDLQPVIDAANAELRGESGKLPPLKAAMKTIIDAAQKDDGSGLEMDTPGQRGAPCHHLHAVEGGAAGRERGLRRRPSWPR